METKRRSLAKALSWRLFATMITATVALIITGKITVALEIGALDTSVKLLVYYGHERLWLHIPYGKPKPPEYEI